MNDNFESCLALTLKYEGGYVNNPRDPGGATNMGITIAALSAELGRSASPAEVRALTRGQAAAIYRKRYWDRIGAGALPPGVDAMLFDIAVNSGPARALQWGRECSQGRAEERIRALDARRRGFYRGLAAFAVFGRGWMERENDLLTKALAMAGRSKIAVSAPADAHAQSQDRPAPTRMTPMKGYRTYIAAAIVAAGGLVAQTDWLAFLANPKAGIVALGSAALMAAMRTVTTSAPGQLH